MMWFCMNDMHMSNRAGWVSNGYSTRAGAIESRTSEDLGAALAVRLACAGATPDAS